MSSIGDSNAVYDGERLYPQHQAALTILQGILDDPEIPSCNWLDLACGKGQILAHITKNLNNTQREKVHFHGYDLNNTYATHTKKLARSSGFASISVEVGDISRFPLVLDKNIRFDFITLTNTTHEVDSRCLAGVLFDCISKLSEQGCLFIYDMEVLPENELGAIPWKASEIQHLIDNMLTAMGANQSNPKYHPSVGQYPHRSCVGWGVQIWRKKFLIDEKISAANLRDSAVEKISADIRNIISSRIESCEKALDALTENDSETEEETQGEIRSLYEFWALKRAERLFK